jgi:hypothetical protein
LRRFPFDAGSEPLSETNANVTLCREKQVLTDDQSISVVIPRKLPPNGKSFFRTLKREEVDAKEFRDLEELRLTHYSVSSIAITTKKDFTRLSDIGPGENSSG